MGTARRLLDEKRDEILRLAALHGAGQVRVFGSVARGDDGPDSDIDLLVHMDDERSLLDLIGFRLDLREVVGCKVDVLSDGGLSPYMRDDILSEARPL
ncbi:MAG: nucleotidyltransferase family protein [Magnetospirillum sp.]|nr:nucleotidyltransferase family protein [Magnetospirillum sp.]